MILLSVSLILTGIRFDLIYFVWLFVDVDESFLIINLKNLRTISYKKIIIKVIKLVKSVKSVKHVLNNFIQ
jgi:hypothetical protein